MAIFAARLDGELLDELQRIDDGTMAIAEVCRRLGSAADRLGLPRPSYERVRVLVHEARTQHAYPSTASVLADVALRARPPEALLDHLAGIPAS